MTDRVKMLIELMKNQGWTMRKTSEDLFVSINTLEKWKAGDTNPGLRSIRDIDALLKKYKVI
jgi:transcriptional regulator with XRE-family HTH domain